MQWLENCTFPLHGELRLECFRASGREGGQFSTASSSDMKTDLDLIRLIWFRGEPRQVLQPDEKPGLG